MEVLNWLGSVYNGWMGPVRWRTPAMASSPRVFNYRLSRWLVERAAAQCVKITNNKIDVIMPYGFELISGAPNWPHRHYPAMGYCGKTTFAQAHNFAMLFIASFLELAQRHYPELYRQLVYCEVHNQSHFSTIHNEQASYAHEQLSTMHIELFETPDILQHYADYLIILINTLSAECAAYPVVAAFTPEKNSKTARNRLFQLFIMCNQVAQTIMPALPRLNPNQQKLAQAIFLELRKTNPTELILDMATHPFSVSPIEYHIRDKLILPRFVQIKQHLKNIPGKRVRIESNVYYGEREAIAADDVPVLFVKQAREIVKQSYWHFMPS